MNFKRALIAGLSLLLANTGCFDYGGGSTGGGGRGSDAGTPTVASSFSNALSISGSSVTAGPLPQQSADSGGIEVLPFPAAGLEVRLAPSDGGAGAGGTSPLTISIPYQGGGVASVNIGFGSGTAPPSTFFNVPTPAAAGVSSGIISIPAQVQNSLCAGLSVQNVCHQIKCYEQVVTPGGTFSKATAAQMVINCTGRDCNGNSVDAGAPVGSPCGNTVDCTVGSVCFSQTCVGMGALRISLAFSVDSDFDLHVKTPSGAEISYSNKMAGGGILDVDQCAGGTCGGGSHVENVMFPTAPAAGTYQIWVINYSARSGGGSFTIDVVGPVNRQFTGTLPATSGASSTVFSIML